MLRWGHIEFRDFIWEGKKDVILSHNYLMCSSLESHEIYKLYNNFTYKNSDFQEVRGIANFTDSALRSGASTMSSNINPTHYVFFTTIKKQR